MDPCDVRMIQVGENLGFELEPVEAIWIVCERLGEDRGGPRNSDRLLRWDPDRGEGVWHATEETELSG